MTSIPELGVVSTHQKDDWFSLNDEQHEQNSSPHSLLKHTIKPLCDAEDHGVHMYVHSEDGFSKHGEESEEEVMFCVD